jgi:hypothetical protein
MKRLKPKVVMVCVLALLLGTASLTLGSPTNDSCSNAKSVGNVTDLAFDTTDATFDGPGHASISRNIWYVYTATCTGCATVSLCGSSYDTLVAAYDGDTCYPTSSDMIESNDDFCDRMSEMTFPVVSGQKYLIEVGGYSASDFGEGVLSISCDTNLCQPSNDDCEDSEWIGNVTNLPFCTTCATFDGPGHCIDSSNIWYLYTAPQTCKVTVSLCGSHFDTMLAVYEGGDCYPAETDLIDCNDDAGCGNFASAVTFDATAGNDYLIEVGGYSASDIGNGVISIYCEGQEPGPMTNDDCSDAKPVGNVTNLSFDTTSSTFDGPGHYIHSPNIWYCYTATCTGDVTIDLCGSGYDTMLAVYKGCGCYPASADLVASNDDSCSQQSRVTFAATTGDKFLVEVGGYGSSTGSGVMTIRCEGEPGPEPCQPANDDCQNATQVGNLTKEEFDTTCATFDGPGHFVTSPNIWYIYTAAATGNVTVSLCGSGYDTKLAIYKGADCYPGASDLFASNDDSCGWQSEATFAATVGQKYLIEVGGFGSKTGKGMITISSEGGGPQPPSELDLGDAPDSTNNYGRVMTAYWNTIQANYPTVFNDGSGTGPYGPLHRNPQAVAYLGNSVSNEDEADIGADQDGHNNIWPVSDTSSKDWHDNGVTFPINMPNCSWTTFNYSVKVVSPGTNLWVNVWCDWNRDGDWDDDSSTYPAFNCTKGFVSEWAVQNQFLYNLPAGLHKLTTPAFLPWHLKNGPKAIWMRITLSEKPWTGGSNPGTKGNGGSGRQAGYDVGETEDYLFAPETAFSICEDYNGDGVINLEDLAAFTTDWLENCSP